MIIGLIFLFSAVSPTDNKDDVEAVLCMPGLSADFSTRLDDNLELSTVTSRFSEARGPGETLRGVPVGVARLLVSPDNVLGSGDDGFCVANTEVKDFDLGDTSI